MDPRFEDLCESEPPMETRHILIDVDKNNPDPVLVTYQRRGQWEDVRIMRVGHMMMSMGPGGQQEIHMSLNELRAIHKELFGVAG